MPTLKCPEQSIHQEARDMKSFRVLSHLNPQEKQDKPTKRSSSSRNGFHDDDCPELVEVVPFSRSLFPLSSVGCWLASALPGVCVVGPVALRAFPLEAWP